MREISNTFNIPENIKTPKIIGRTRIELRNVHTGKKEVFESKNTFQSAYLTAFLRGFGKANANPFNNSTWAGRPLWRNLVGGILLFRDTITAPAEYMPAGNLMVGNGSYGISNNGTPTELGSYNEVESATSGMNSLTFVYDWGTSQANGTIGCICLTTEDGGYIGYGNASGNNAETRSLTARQSSTRQSAHFYYNGKAYRVTAVDMTSKKVSVGAGTDGITIASIFQDQNEVVADYTYTGDILGSNAGAYILVRPISNSEFAIIKGNANQNIQLSNGSSGNILVFDASTNTLSKQTITNTSGGSIDVLTGSSNPSINITKDANGNIYIPQTGPSGTTKLLKFNSSGTYQGEAAPGNSSAAFGRLTSDLIYSQETDNGPVYIFDGTNARVSNGYANRSFGPQMEYNAGYDAFFYSTDARYSIAPYRNPLYLATINNLDSAITKDSTQTMKIIYTLTEASS